MTSSGTNHNMNFLKDPLMFSDIETNTPSPTGLKSSFQFPVTPDTLQKYLQSQSQSNFIESGSQWQGGSSWPMHMLQQHQMQIQQQQHQMQPGANYMQNPNPNHLSLQLGVGEQIPERVLKEVSNTQNNNSQQANRSTGEVSVETVSKPVNYHQCPGCDSFFEVSSPAFILHVRAKHHIEKETAAFNYFVRRHPYTKKLGADKTPKLLSCITCGKFYEDADELNKCLARHKIDQLEKNAKGVKKSFQRKQASPRITKTLLNAKDRLMCDFEGCKDKKGFKNRESLLKHQRKLHNLYRTDMEKRNGENQRYRCSFCENRCFSTSGNLLRHVAQCKSKPVELETPEILEVDDTLPKADSQLHDNKADSHPQDDEADTHPQDAKMNTQPEEAKADTQPQDAKVDTQPQDAKLDTQHKDATESKPVGNQVDINEIAPPAGTSEETFLSFSQSSTEGMIF